MSRESLIQLLMHGHDDSCGCGHDHHEHEEHHHDHEDACGCGHDHHEHEEDEYHDHDHEDECGCGHDHHEHEHHHHDHEDECGCGHDHHDHEHHHHDHEDECGCGHDHHDHEHHHHDHEDECGCGHDHHDHEHHHDHEDECGCGHDHHEHHHHDHEDECGCGHDHHDHEHHHHDHEDECGCGHDHHDHEHHHDHGDGCGCGHDHDHEEHDQPTRSHTHFVVEHHHTEGHPDDCTCEVCNPHVEYCDVCGESLAKCTCKMPDEDVEKRVYILEGLDCANCAAKVEAKIRTMPEVAFATVAYATKQLRVSANNQDELLPKMQALVDSIEDGITIVPRKRKAPNTISDTKIYILQGLDCANCAAKIEAKLRTLPGVDDVTITYATKQMKLSARRPDDLIPTIKKTIDAMEDGITIVPKSMPKAKVYILDGLDCANCAAKIEAKLRTLPGVDDVTITYATKQMKLYAKRPDDLIPEIKKTIDAMEDGITIIPKEEAKKETAEKEEKKSAIPEKYKPLVSIGIGAALFIVGFCLIHIGGWEESDLRLFPIYIVSYLILGGKVLMTAAKNMRKGQWFDENFLMAIATLGAFGIREFPEAVGVMLFYRIGEYFEERATEQSRSQIMEAVDLRPEVINLVVGDDIRVIDAEEAVVGDIVLVRPGDRVPLDGVVIEGETRLDTSAITGEPVPVKVGVGDVISSGCVNTSGQIKMRVEKVLEESMVTRILDSVENAAASKPNIDKFITRFARVYTPFVVFFALFVAIVLPFILPNWHFFVNADYTGAEGVLNGTTGTASVLTALTFLVISCPCALVLSVPLAFFAGIGAASKKNILFKGGVAIESLKAVKAVVMDKTGTITKGNFVVQNAVSADQKVSSEQLLAISASCELSSTHPIGNSIVEAAKEKNLDIERPSKVEEIAGHGIRATISQGTVLCGNRKLMEENNIDLSGYHKDQFGTEVLTALNGKFIGHIVISDTIKEDAVDAIAKTKKLGIVTAMLTGDAEDSAKAVAAEAGIDEVHAKLLPQDKFNELQKIREQHGAVMFVGDGINDAPVLAGADVGAAMGSGADAAIEAADVVFMTSEMEAIPQAIDIARATGRISWQNVYFALAVKIIVMIMGLFGFANMWVAVFADTGVSMLCLINSMRILYRK